MPGIPAVRTRPRAMLIVAHPGHELLLHNWLERERPIVCALTDGSGGAAQDRSCRSRTIIERTGARVGPLFGATPDRDWYQAILARDRRPFDAAAEAIAAVGHAEGVTQIVADPLELFNPMHDLCSALAQRVAGEMQNGLRVELLTYPIERPELLHADPADVHALDREALERKLAAIAEYHELKSEVERRRVSAHENFAVERLFAADVDRLWPAQPAEEPFYEKFGRERIARGTYADLITYAGHVRPLAVLISGRS